MEPGLIWNERLKSSTQRKSLRQRAVITEQGERDTWSVYFTQQDAQWGGAGEAPSLWGRLLGPRKELKLGNTGNTSNVTGLLSAAAKGWPRACASIFGSFTRKYFGRLSSNPFRSVANVTMVVSSLNYTKVHTQTAMCRIILEIFNATFV